MSLCSDKDGFIILHPTEIIPSAIESRDKAETNPFPFGVRISCKSCFIYGPLN